MSLPPAELTVEYCSSLWDAVQQHSAGLISGLPQNCLNADLPQPSAVSSDQAAERHRDVLHFPGFLARRGGTILGVVGCTLDSDGALSATLPVLPPTTAPPQRAAVVHALFAQVRALASKSGARHIHCLVPLPDVAARHSPTVCDAEQLMKASGLEPAATILQLQKTVAARSRVTAGSSAGPAAGWWAAAATPVSVQPLTDCLTNADRRQQLEAVLDEILSDSQDLPRLLRPTGRGLLQVWQQRRAVLFSCGPPEQPVAVAAVSGLEAEPQLTGQGGRNSEKLPAGQALTGTQPQTVSQPLTVTLEYLGVGPAWRRRGLARQLLTAVERAARMQAAGLHAGDLRQAVITAWVDAANPPALRLYGGAAYVPVDAYRLYQQTLCRA